MHIDVKRHELQIVPDSIQDEIWLEEVLGLKTDGHMAQVTRVNIEGLKIWDHAKVTKQDFRADPEVTGPYYPGGFVKPCSEEGVTG